MPLGGSGGRAQSQTKILGKGMERRINGKICDFKYASGRKSFLSEAVEKELPGVVKMLYQRGFHLSMKNVQQLAFSFAKAYDVNYFCIHTTPDSLYYSVQPFYYDVQLLCYMFK